MAKQPLTPTHLVISLCLAVLPYSINVGEWGYVFGREVPWALRFASGMGCSAVYSYDRLSDTDRIGRKIILCIMACMSMGMCIIGLEHTYLIPNAVLLSIPTSFYTHKIPGIGMSIKNAFPLSKTLFVPLVHVSWWMIVNNVDPLALIETHASSVFCMYMHFLLVNVSMDLKDLEEDQRNGVVTIPGLLGSLKASIAFLVLCDMALAVYSSYTSSTVLVGLFLLDAILTLIYAVCEWIPTNRMLLPWCLLLRTSRLLLGKL